MNGKFKKVQYLGLEFEGRTFLIDLNNMVVEERLEEYGHWEVIDADFAWCQEGEFIFDENHQLTKNKITSKGGD